MTTYNSFAFETREKFFKISAEKPQAKQRATREKIKSSRVHTYQHLDLRDVNRAHYVSSFSVLFVSLCCCCCCCSLFFSLSLSFSFSFDSIDLDFSLFSLGKSCCCLCVEMMRASLLNRLTYTLCFFRASLLLTRALPFLLPMYYRCITSASFILSPSLLVCVCVCNIYHRTRAGKSEDEFENYSNR